MNREEIKRLILNRNVCTIFYRSFHTDAGCKREMNVKRCLRLSLHSQDFPFGSCKHWKGIERKSPFVCTQKIESNLSSKGDSNFIECLLFFRLQSIWISITSTWIKDQSNKVIRTISKKKKSRNEIYSQSPDYYDLMKKKTRFPFYLSVMMVCIWSVLFTIIIPMNGFYAN